MMQLYAGAGVFVAVLLAVVMIKCSRGSSTRRSREQVEASEIASWMSELMDGVGQPALPWHTDIDTDTVAVAVAEVARDEMARDEMPRDEMPRDEVARDAIPARSPLFVVAPLADDTDGDIDTDGAIDDDIDEDTDEDADVEVTARLAALFAEAPRELTVGRRDVLSLVPVAR